MSREIKVRGIILKKQELFEADEIITFYTKELGKIRAKAVSVKKSKSRLLGSLLNMSEVSVRLVGSEHLRIIAGASVENSHSGAWASTEKMHFFYWLAETIIKATPDEVPDPQVFLLLKKVLRILGYKEFSASSIRVLFCYTALRLVDFLGFAITIPEISLSRPGFSMSSGGIVERSESPDAIAVSGQLVEDLHLLSGSTSDELPGFLASSDELKDLLLSYVSFQIERSVHSGRYI